MKVKSSDAPAWRTDVDSWTSFLALVGGLLFFYTLIELSLRENKRGDRRQRAAEEAAQRAAAE